MTPADLFSEFTAGFPARKFSAGLLMAFIDLYTELGVPGAGLGSYQGVIARFPRQTTTNGGKRANTLIVVSFSKGDCTECHESSALGR